MYNFVFLLSFDLFIKSGGVYNFILERFTGEVYRYWKCDFLGWILLPSSEVRTIHWLAEYFKRNFVHTFIEVIRAESVTDNSTNSALFCYF